MEFTYSVIVPTTNNSEQLYPCLTSIVSHSDMKVTEIIVVDNGSTDSTNQICEIFKTQLGDSFKFVRLEENKGFCVGTNEGLKISSGKYVVWLNDDTLATTNWLEGLRSSIETPHMTHSNIGLAGPRSNCVAGGQHIKELSKMLPTDLATVTPQVLAESHKYRLQSADGSVLNAERLTTFLSGFCLMVKREVMDKIGYIDELYSPGGFCDNDYVTRAIRAGFGCVISEHSFVYHAGSQTLNRLYPEMRGGVKNWSKYISKFKETGDKTLLMIQRVKIDTDGQLSTFKKCAFRNEEFVDGVIILSDKSEHKEFSESSCRKIFGKKLLGFYTNPKTAEFHEIRDRVFIMKEAEKHPHDWVIMLDHDEALSQYTDKARLKELMNPLDPALCGYNFLFNNFWRGDTMARIDGPWGSSFFSRMWKNHIFEPRLRPLYGPDDKGLHCGNRPMSIAPDGFKVCDITIDHYGYSDYEEAGRKRTEYRKIDNTATTHQKFLAGTENYEHLTNEVGIRVLVPRPFSVSLNAMVKNEESTIGMQILNYASLVREFVICDTGSTDSTKEALDEVGIPYFEMPFDDSFSIIRNELLKRSKYDYVLHVDADELPEPKYLEKMVGMLNSAPDLCMFHMKTQQKDGKYSVVKLPRVFKNDGRFYYYGRVHETLDKSVAEVGNPSIMDAGLTIFNPGLLIDAEKLKTKLNFYGRLLEMEIQDHPDNVKSMFELALHYRNFDRTDDAIRLLSKCSEIKPDFAKAKFELALIHANRALEQLDTCEGLQVDPDLLQAMRQLHGGLASWKFQPVKL
jgi:GT2 family glycosyltransferase